MTSPIDSSGTVTSRCMIGSSRMGRALASASLKPIEAAILNAISDESTSWYSPSKSVTLKSTTGEPVRMPRGIASRMPFSTAGMYCRGIDAADDLVDELEAAAARQRLDLDPGVAELAAAARLLLELALRLGAALDGLAIRAPSAP